MKQKAFVCEAKMIPSYATRLPAILKNSQPTSGRPLSVNDPTDAASARPPESGSPESSPDTPRRRDKPRKKVSFRVSELRRQSLTGSLPDLTKASEKDVQTSSGNLKEALQIHRAPLPEGSSAFQAVMDEMDTDSDGESATLRHSWNDGDERTQDKKRYSARGQTFQSKAAAVIYSKLYVPSLHRSRNKSAGSNGSARKDNAAGGHQAEAAGGPPSDGRSAKETGARHLTPPASCCRPDAASSSRSSPSLRRSRQQLGSSPSPARGHSPTSAASDRAIPRRNLIETRRKQKS